MEWIRCLQDLIALSLLPPSSYGLPLPRIACSFASVGPSGRSLKGRTANFSNIFLHPLSVSCIHLIADFVSRASGKSLGFPLRGELYHVLVSFPGTPKSDYRAL
jgi:hypothetical protein